MNTLAMPWTRVRRRPGLTLLELTVVLVVLVALAGILVPMTSSITSDAQQTATQATMKALRDAVLAYYQDMKGLDVSNGVIHGNTGMPFSLKDLQIQPSDSSGNLVPRFDPSARRGWRGPYLQQATGKWGSKTLDASFAPYGNSGEPAFVDGWGNPIVLQWPTTADAMSTHAQYVRLVSAGPSSSSGSSTLDTLASVLMPTQNERGNDLVLFILTQDLYP